MQSKIINLPHILEIGDDQKQKSSWGTALNMVSEGAQLEKCYGTQKKIPKKLQKWHMSWNNWL